MSFRSENDSNGKEIRVAWLAPSLDRGFYWQPLFREITNRFPKTVIFTGVWPGFLKGCEGAFEVRLLRGVKFVTLKRSAEGYDTGFLWTPASLLPELLRLRPHIIFTSGLQLWTLFGIVLKFLFGSCVVILWEGTSPSIEYLNAPGRLMIRRAMARFLDACISNTNDGVRYLHDVLCIPYSKLLRHPYEVPDPKFLDSQSLAGKLQESVERPTFLCVGGLIGRKGVGHLLHACSLLREQGVTSFSLVVVGSGPEGDAFQKLAKSLGLEQRVHWVGQVPYEKLGAYFRAADVFVFPTLEDVWGLVLLEAMALGKPVLCSKYAGSKEIVRNGENGFVFDPRQPEELAQIMARFIREPELIKNFGEKSRKIIAPFTPESAANILAKTITHVLNQDPQRGTLTEGVSFRSFSQ